MTEEAAEPTGEAKTRARWIARPLCDERVRFVIAGALNTVVGYAVFVLFELLIGHHTSCYVSLIASFLLATIFAFLVHRNYTFRVAGTGSVLLDFVRFQSVSVISLLVNAVLLPLCVE